MFLVLCALLSTAPDLSLVEGVQSVAKPGIPGVVSIVGPSGNAFLEGRSGKNRLPVAATGRLGRGRVVAIGHDGYLSAEQAKVGDTALVLARAIRWASGGLKNPKIGLAPRIGADFLPTIGLTGTPIQPKAPLADRPDVLVVTVDVPPVGVESWIRNGGGVVVATTPWGWQMLNPGKNLVRDLAWNPLLAKAGIVFSDGMVDEVKPVASPSDAAALSAHLAAAGDPQPQSLPLLTTAARALEAGHPLRRRLAQIAAKAPAKIPTEKGPITVADGLARIAITLGSLEREADLRPKADPAARDFPGAVPIDAPRTTLSFDAGIGAAGWIGTGAYAAPGEAIVVEVPQTLAAQGYSIQIGAHTDQNWHHDRWTRHPEITVRRRFNSPRATMTSAFGGLVYLVVDRVVDAVPIRLSNVVRAPRFVLGETKDWSTQLGYGAPWAEFESGKLILTVPTEDARRVQDPEELMRLWDETMDLYAEIKGKPLPRRPERIVADRQISAGYMHAGYPIMTHLDAVELSLSVKQLRQEGSWGHWHELGHNHQEGWWTFEGTGEVTCNIFTMLAMERISKRPAGWRLEPMAAKVKEYLAKPDYSQWKSDPFLALTMYWQLQKAFGWEGYERTFRSYYASRPNELPRSDLEKRDQWMVRFSRAVGRNLGPFFERWGVPTSPGARRSIEELPTWLPEGW